MPRKGSGFRTAIKILKAIDKVQKQSVRQAEQNRKLKERESAAFRKELASQAREKERQWKAKTVAAQKHENALHKAAIESENSLFEKRVQERAKLRTKFIRETIK